MARILARSEQILPRGFGARAPAPGDRWPMPLAAAAIMGMSAVGWVLLLQAGRALMSLAG